MRFATNCAKAYARASAPTRRRFNQAVFTRIEVRDSKIAAVGYHPPFDLLFSSSEFEYGDLVEMMGLEPMTPCLQSRCSSQLSYIPLWPSLVFHLLTSVTCAVPWPEAQRRCVAPICRT